MQRLESKRAAIVAMRFLPGETATVENSPGAKYINLMGPSIDIIPQSAEFKETIAGNEQINQQLNAVVTNISITKMVELRKFLAFSGLLVLQYSNEETRVVGTDEFPVLIQIEENGRPASLKLSFKRSSPEPAKFLQSF